LSELEDEEQFVSATSHAAAESSPEPALVMAAPEPAPASVEAWDTGAPPMGDPPSGGVPYDRNNLDVPAFMRKRAEFH
jgi:hypothetical protein